MFGISFLNSGLLGFAAATVLPLIIWFIARKKPPRIVFSTIRFILRSEKQQKKRTQLRNILLLIIRMLIILLTALAISRPQLRMNNLLPGGQHAQTALALVLDTSPSMGYVSDGKTALDRAKETIKRINSLATEADNLVLLTSDANWNRLYAQNHQGKLPEALIDRIGLCEDPIPMESIIKQAHERLRDSMMSNREICLLTDLQEQNLPHSPEYPVTIIPVTPADAFANLSCTAATAVPQLTQRSGERLLQCEVTNYGNRTVKDIPLRVVLGDVTVAEKFISLDQGQRVTETIPVRINKSGWQTGYIEVGDERLAFDNRSWFAFRHNPQPKVAVLTARRSLPPLLNSLLKVYATKDGSVSLLDQSVASSQSLRPYDLIVVFDPGELTPKLRELLKNHAALGRKALYILPKDISPGWKAFVNTAFSVQLGELLTAETGISFVNPRHYITQIIHAGQIRQVSLRSYRSCRIDAGAEVLLSVPASPLAVSNTSGVLWLFDVEDLGAELFWSPSFAVFAHRSCSYAAANDASAVTMQIGQTVSGKAITLPDGNRIELNVNRFRLAQSGLFRLAGVDGEPEPIAVNHTTSESSYRKQNVKSLKNYILSGERPLDHVFRSSFGTDLWKALLLAALLLFGLELLIVKVSELRAFADSNPSPDSQ